MPLTSILLEFSEDPMSDASPTWVDVTSDLVEIEWWAGVSREGDEPDAGGATIRLNNRLGRRWEPDYTAGMFYPNITTGRRFRLTLNDGLGAVQQGVWYVTDISLEFVGGTKVSQVTMSCGDGFEVLALDNLPLMDPPEATSYEDVVQFDEPLGYYVLGEASGTKLVSQVKKQKRRNGNHRNRRIRTTKRVTAAELGAVSGESGAYIGLPTLGVAGQIVGDSNTAASFNERGVVSYGKIANDIENFSEPNAFTFGGWVASQAISASLQLFLSGPFGTTAATNSFSLAATAANKARLTVATLAGTVTCDSTTGLDSVQCLWGTSDGTVGTLYVNGVAEATVALPGNLRTGDANEFLRIGSGESPLDTFPVVMQHVEFHETCLTPERIMARYVAGTARGWPEQTAGERIVDIATNALWSTASVQTTGRDVLPQFQFGQPRVEEIAELAHAEGPTTQFFFNGTGNPVYLGHEWEASSSSYYTSNATLGDGTGEVSYELDGVEFVYDNETYNDVTVSHENGEAVTVTDSTSISERGRRSNAEFTDVLLMEHTDVESLASRVLAFYQDPALRPVSVSLNGANNIRLSHILRRDLGHLIRVKRRGEGGTPIDRVTSIIQKRKRLDNDGNLWCTWSLGRGFNAAADNAWHAGIVGFSEAGQTTDAA